MQAIGGIRTTCDVLHTFMVLLDSRVLVREASVRCVQIYSSVSISWSQDQLELFTQNVKCFLCWFWKKWKSIGLPVSFIRSIFLQATVPKLCSRSYFIYFVVEVTQQCPQYLKLYSLELEDG